MNNPGANLDKAKLVQSQSHKTSRFEAGENTSTRVSLEEERPRSGFDVVVKPVPGGPWTDAAIAFEVSLNGNDWYPCHDKDGNLLKIKGISLTLPRKYAAPPEMWGVGAWNYLRLLSVNATTDVAVNQVSDVLLSVVLLS